ncbi:hypothetical protein [Xylocopilactobacillus apicola]|uniref:Uncharacterized protein n=1 Tax=Xylocopilactobacillus apicola TaxID=2932184 RepID=A0AAU9DTU5_9LACO|nr:hypothetical protein [Xylocopilactobacillus apicola]BDR58853.1 hypothetical protein XA3_12940 [Xylocopilactobacillus apicola]
MVNLNYRDLIAQMMNDPKKEILIKHQDFKDFHEVWLKEPHRDEIVGKALKGGDIIYHYQPKK